MTRWSLFLQTLSLLHHFLGLYCESMSNRDGILDSHPSERVTMPPELAAFDRWAKDRNDLAKWEAAMAALAPAAAADELGDARDALALADDGQPQAATMRKLAALVKAARPLPASASFRPASHITDPLPRPILRASGMDGAVLAEGAVCLLSGAGGSAKSTLATTLALDLAFGVLLVAHSRKAARGADADPYDPGQVAGVGAWADAARGVLTLTGRGDDRTLAISKANWGRAYVQTQLAQAATEAGALVGFNAGSDGWGPPPPKDPVRRLKTLRRPPIYPNPFRCPHAVLRWIRA